MAAAGSPATADLRAAAPRPLRVLLFSTLFPSESRPLHGVFVETRLRELLKTGAVEAEVVAPVPWFPSRDPRWGDRARFAATPDVETRHGVRIHHPRYLLLPKVGMSTAPLTLALGALSVVRRLQAEGRDFDLIDAHYYYPDGVAAALLARWLDKPLLITARGSDVNLIAEHAVPLRWMRWAARQAGASIGVSAALVRRMAAIGLPDDRLHVVRNGVDLERFVAHDPAAMRAELGLPADVPLLLTVGNIHEHKGQRLAIEALAVLRGGARPQARLLVIGAGPDEAHCRRLAERLGVAEAVHWIGQVPNIELSRWYSAADALILASSREGWPNVLLEAMACGAPVVASDVGGVREIVQQPVAGRVVATREAPAFAAALADLLDAAVPRPAVRAYAADFGWDHTSQTQLGLFARVRGGACNEACAHA
ncbi:glycosyltransferase [Pseudaquabacterium rugosum]|uniref:Glycosyltransferase n=1 Tax=Pseudaquabacterium rugosum TaxID=2984194 RepID=A0ABU9B4B8_9BURK